MLEVVARIRWQVAYLYRRKSGIPSRRVVGPAPPGMIDGHQPRFLGISKGRQISMPGKEPGVNIVQEGTRRGKRLLALTPGGIPDTPDGDGMNRRLAKAAGVRWRSRGVGGGRGASPVLRAGIIAVGRGLRVEDDMGNLAGLPLVSEQGTEFEGGTTYVEVRKPDGYERAVPAPLVRVEPWRGTGPTSHIVLA
ncbi:MAG: hypothetical protein M3272_03125 [Actinomycetota bacterium]|nr:hypothetical protein [Actinomycetota bacterium]